MHSQLGCRLQDGVDRPRVSQLELLARGSQPSCPAKTPKNESSATLLEFLGKAASCKPLGIRRALMACDKGRRINSALQTKQGSRGQVKQSSGFVLAQKQECPSLLGGQALISSWNLLWWPFPFVLLKARPKQSAIGVLAVASPTSYPRPHLLALAIRTSCHRPLLLGTTPPTPATKGGNWCSERRESYLS